jgi:uncharacterized protein (TIGR03083 family)
MDHEWFCARTEDEIARMASATEGANPATPVPTCPEWTLARLIRHTGTVHRWVTQIVTTRAAARLPRRDLDTGLPEDKAAYPKWLASGADPLLVALREAGPGTSVWTWGDGGTSGWWARRMLHETAVHRADAELAVGIDPEFDSVVAADGIEEFIANQPTDHVAELPAGQTLHLHATDFDGEWLLTFGPDRVAWERGHAKATAAVRGPVGLLLLFTLGRLRPEDERLEVFGDAALLAAWQEKMAF